MRHTIIMIDGVEIELEPGESITIAAPANDPVEVDDSWIRLAGLDDAEPVRTPAAVAEAARAVEAFFRLLQVDPAGRIGGAEAYAVFCSRRAAQGWPGLCLTEFGSLARDAVEVVGGKRIRSNGTYFSGVRLPPHMRLRLVSEN